MYAVDEGEHILYIPPRLGTTRDTNIKMYYKGAHAQLEMVLTFTTTASPDDAFFSFEISASSSGESPPTTAGSTLFSATRWLKGP